MIFRDTDGRVIAGTGSLNETIGGLYNVEEMQFSFSWKGDEDLTCDLVESFERIWSGQEEAVNVFDLDFDFANRILQILESDSNPMDETLNIATTKNQSAKKILELMRSSRFYSPYNLSNAALYPHQERVFSEALSRWPIRVLLADEVGLGKTLEAGILIAYLQQTKISKKVLILCPASLVRQWQEELKRHFELNFSRYDSSTKQFIDSDGEIQSVGNFKDPSKIPNLMLVSSQWARLNPEVVIKLNCDLLVVDEAHAARIHIDQYGSRASLLWKLLNEMKANIPHLLLLTATPMQVHPSELHGLLKLIGLPKQWEKFEKYEDSLKAIASKSETLTLNDAKIIADLVLNSHESYSWLPEVISNSDTLHLMKMRELKTSGSSALAIYTQNNAGEIIRLLTKIHPGHLLTCRNTKKGLEKFGYKFPRRNFHAPEIHMDAALERYEISVENYLSSAYGKTEESLKPNGNFPIGFAKSGYYQRLVSSLSASKSSLKKRREKLDSISNAIYSADSELINKVIKDFDIEDDDSIADDYSGLTISVKNSEELSKILAKVSTAINLENSYIEELLGILEKLGENVEKADPKFASAMNVLQKELKEAQVLVFSRYTDTLNGFLSLFESDGVSDEINGYALYTGNEAWIQTKYGRVNASKTDVTNALNSGAIQVVFCSDAASEGLNLQSAKVLLNLDVPWNPARLEQRIGRIARLGQQAQEVQIFNFWYPESIEAKMYTRLLSRKSDYELVVGEAADIFSSSIQAEISERLNGHVPSKRDVFADLQEVRQDFQRLALEKIWISGSNQSSISRDFRVSLLQGLQSALEPAQQARLIEQLSVEPGLPESFTLKDSRLDHPFDLLEVNNMSDGEGLIAIKLSNHLIAFGVLFGDERIGLVSFNSIGKVLQAITGVKSLEKSDFFGDKFSKELLASKLQIFVSDLWNVPNHNFAKLPYAGILEPSLTNDFSNLEMELICKVLVS